VGEYLRLRSEYQRLVKQGKIPDVRTAGQALTSANCPLIDPAGGAWPGAGPLRYLNAVFERLRVRSEGGAWQEVALPTAPGAPVEIRLPTGKAVELEAWAGNTAEATWLRGNVALSVGNTNVPLAADTAFQGSGHLAATRGTDRLQGTLKLRLQVGAEGRARFGEIVEVTVTAEG